MKAPQLCRQKRPNGSDLAYATVNGRRFYFGPHGTTEAHHAYDKFIRQLEANGGELPIAQEDVTVAVLVDRWRKSKTPRDVYRRRAACKPLLAKYGTHKTS
ncbi:MAG: hypothetical protein ACFCVE_16190, partial [Phycisphaerae bacterium]